jgi:hypothetical protein
MTNIRTFAAIALLTGICVFPTSALAVKPTITYFESAEYTIPSALTGCGFDVLITPINSKMKFIAFTDQDDNLRVLLLNGPNLVLLTNVSTGKSLIFNSSAPGKLLIESDSSFRALVEGPALLILAPGAAPGFPQFAFTKGKLDMIVTPDFVTQQINDFRGTVQDVCDLLG